LAGIDVSAIERWFARSVPGAPPPLRFQRLSGGRSNLTYLVEDSAGGRWALRRPPLGERLASAHDVAREFRIMSALKGTLVPVPPVVALCEDETVIGAPFYVAGFVEGRVLRTTADADLAPAPEERRRIGERLVETLAQLHSLEPAEVGLGDLSRSEAYVERQLRRWRSQWEKSKVRELPAIERLHERLSGSIPPQGSARVVHGDYRLDNVIVGTGGEVAAVVDWELCTLGDPLADVGLLLVYWAPEGEDLIPRFDPATRAAGFPSREEVVELYARLSGRDLSQIDFYVAFSLWRVAIILEGVRVRYAAGQYGGEDWAGKEAAEAIARIADAAERMLPARS
jgi:aminoglycoside phosphotransferase (APT) family kinase protein